MKIAADVMGGDNAPQVIVGGVMLAERDFPGIEFQLYGREAEIKKCITDEKSITIIHADEKVVNGDEPVKAIRRKKTASMILAAQAVKNEEADAIFSAGDTGALLTAGLLIVGHIKNVERLGLVSVLPVMGEPSKGFDMLDLGANADNKPEHSVQYVVLGSFYVEKIRDVQSPRVGLLNNGTEETKDGKLTKRTFELLAADETINSIGSIEAQGLLNGVADVVVTGGFTGNAILKSIENTAMNMVSSLKTAIPFEDVRGEMDALSLRSALRGMRDKVDYSKHGGAVLFGLEAPIIKTHGTTGPDAVNCTTHRIHTMLETQVVPQLVEYYEGKAK